MYNEHQKKRHLVRPGITGLAQINGRNAISWNDKFDFDVNYVHDLSFALDLQILIKTVLKVIKRQGIQSGQEVTMPKFTGNEDIWS